MMLRHRPPSAVRARAGAFFVGITLGLTACGGSEPEATTEDVEVNPLSGTDIEFIVPYAPGGGYDLYARAIAPYLGECLEARVVPINEPGAGGLLATNNTAVAAPDGTRIQITNTLGYIVAQIAEAEGVNFSLEDLTWLARIAGEPSVFMVGADSEFEDFQDVIDSSRPITVASGGPGSTGATFAPVLSEIYGFDVDVISGFQGGEEEALAVTQGRADVQIRSAGSAASGVRAGDLRALTLIGTETHPLLPDTPTVSEYPAPEGQEENLTALVNLVETARGIAAPPGMDAATTEALREGLECALTNEEFLAEAEAQERELDFLPGEEMGQLVRDSLDAPPTFVEIITQSSSGG